MGLGREAGGGGKCLCRLKIRSALSLALRHFGCGSSYFLFIFCYLFFVTWVACSLHGSGCDKSGCHNLGRAMAENMLQSGIVKVHWDQRGKKYHGKVKAFVDAIVAGGVSFKESAPFTA